MNPGEIHEVDWDGRLIVFVKDKAGKKVRRTTIVEIADTGEYIISQEGYTDHWGPPMLHTQPEFDRYCKARPSSPVWFAHYHEDNGFTKIIPTDPEEHRQWMERLYDQRLDRIGRETAERNRNEQREGDTRLRKVRKRR